MRKRMRLKNAAFVRVYMRFFHHLRMHFKRKCETSLNEAQKFTHNGYTEVLLCSPTKKPEMPQKITQQSTDQVKPIPTYSQTKPPSLPNPPTNPVPHSELKQKVSELLTQYSNGLWFQSLPKVFEDTYKIPFPSDALKMTELSEISSVDVISENPYKAILYPKSPQSGETNRNLLVMSEGQKCDDKPSQMEQSEKEMDLDLAIPPLVIPTESSPSVLVEELTNTEDVVIRFRSGFTHAPIENRSCKTAVKSAKKTRYVGKNYSAAQELMEDEMKDYYNVNASSMRLNSLKVAQLVAVKVEDEIWLRAQILSVEGNKIKVLYVDHGFNEVVDCSKVCRLDKLFYSLPFQAAKCRLAAIASLLKAGVIAPIPEKERFTGFYSNLFVVPKKDGKVRPILDLKLLNRRICLNHFRMESFRSVIASMESQELLCAIDIQDAYLHVPIFPGHHRFLRFAVLQEHFQFVTLPFGLATAPRVFTKIMAALVAILRVRGLVLFPYLDDILIKAPSFSQAHESLSIALDTLARFGWLVNRKKSCLIPFQRVFLGMLFDTRQTKVFLPKDKRSILCRDIRLHQGPRPPSFRSAMKVLGRMVATLESIPFAQFHSRPLQQVILSQWDRSVLSLDRPVRLSLRVKRSLNWWLTSPLISQGRSFLPAHWQVVTMDASLLGWGAVFRHLTVQGHWSAQESTLPINVLEIWAIFLSLRHWERILRGLPIRIQTDNATAVAYVNHQGGTRSSLALAEVSKILLLAETTVPVISAVHIPSVDNWAADFLSREGLAAGEWSLHQEVFHQICLRWGTRGPPQHPE
ncbi:unnamed protein product [Ranitomeya imitator]|uniref:ribonuclease H n=1 Tax=Ranitomeya imitator TaxID=111125 RepID=A0ABN9M2S7_9NEOB|nr:unnamed protein product [Ranitomeya imitator]